MTLSAEGDIFFNSISSSLIALSTEQFEFLLSSSPSSSDIPAWSRSEFVVLVSFTKPGALSTLTVILSDRLMGVTVWIIPTARSSDFSDCIKHVVMKKENRSTVTKMN